MFLNDPVVGGGRSTDGGTGETKLVIGIIQYSECSVYI